MRNRPDTLGEAHRYKAALEMLEKGDLEGAERICSNIGPGHPDHAAVLHLMGVLAYRRNDLTSARNALEGALAVKPRMAAYRSDLGMVHMAQMEHVEALRCFTLATKLDPASIQAHNNGGLSLLALKRPEEALHWFQRAISIDAGFAQAHLNLGLAHRDLKNTQAARNAFQSALVLNPKYAKAHFFLGDLCESEKDSPGAIHHFQEAIRVKPDYGAAYNRLAMCLSESGCLDEAICWMSRSIAQSPANAETFCNYGNILRKSGEFRQAADMYRRAVKMKPEWAEAHFNLGLVHLLLGDLEHGWPEFEWRLRLFPPDSGYPQRHGLPLWQGESLCGKSILVYDEQGFGDVFLFARYLTRLKSAGAYIVLETRPALMTFFQKWPHINELVVRAPHARPARTCDYCLPLASLPQRMGTRQATIPAEVPYLEADPALKNRWSQRMRKGAFKLGIVWSGSGIDAARDLDLDLLAPLSLFKEIGIYGLQKTSVTTPSATNLPAWIDNLGMDLKDFCDTAAAIANCDLILSIDTAVAHLAGAMAVPVWIMLPFVSDWRWFLDRSDTPWYPTARLFRQHQPGQWTLPVSEALVELRQLVVRKLHPHVAQTVHHAADTAAAESHYRQAMWFQENNQIEHAIDAYRKAVLSDPEMMAAHYNLGVMLYRQGQWPDAAACFQTALAKAPDFAQGAFNLALAYDDCRLHSAALDAYRQALAIAPDFVPAAYNLGLGCFRAGRYQDAVRAFRQAIAADPNHHDAHNNLGLAHHHAGQLDEAILSFKSAIRLKPDYVHAYQNLGNAYMDLGQWDRTVSCYRKALDLKPNDPTAHFEMGKLFQQVLDLENAGRCFETAVSLQPENAEAHYELGQLLLMQGNYLDGWKHFNRRFECTKSRVTIYPYSFDMPSWDGSTFRGRTLFVHCEQGFGDTIQFARFIPLVKALGGDVHFQVQPALLPLFEGFPGVDRLMALTDSKPDHLDAHMVVPIMNLPGCLRITESEIPSQVPYLYARDEEAARWKSVLAPDKFNIGIVWSGNPIQPNNPRRACTPDNFLALAALPGIQLYSLQKKLTENDANSRLFLDGAAIHLGDQLENFGDTAALIASLDLIVSTDTSVPHLAGAMGKPVWILLSHLPDWRWGMNRDDCVWYPTARLFRQHLKGAWGPVFENVRNALLVALTRSKFRPICTPNELNKHDGMRKTF